MGGVEDPLVRAVKEQAELAEIEKSVSWPETYEYHLHTPTLRPMV